jgi:radical SAM protein with 4Fe4S-binding SPASM domain
MQELGVRHEVSTGLLIPKTNRDESPLVQILTDDQFTQMLEETNGAGMAEGSEVGNCRPGHVRGAITPDGNVSPCEWLTDFKLGNIREKSLLEIWYSQPFLDFRKIFDEEPECHTCELRPGCQRCPAQSYLETGHLQHCAPVPSHYAELYQEYCKSQTEG